MSDEILPHGESLRRALRWMSEQGRHDAAAIDEAAQRFDLTPLEEDFLLNHFNVHRKDIDPHKP